MSQRHNLVRDPAAVLLTDWGTDSSSAGAVITANVGTGPSGLVSYARVTTPVSVTRLGVRIGGSGQQLTTPGQTFTFSAFIRLLTAATTTGTLIIRWIDAAGAAAGAAAVVAGATLIQNRYNRVSVTGVAPSNAVRADLYARVIPTTGTIDSGDLVDVSGALFEQTDTLGAFFYPGNGITAFDGASFLSTSTLYTAEWVLTPQPDAAPPRVDVELIDISPGVPTVDVYRLAAGREYQLRGGVQAVANGALARVDFEAPFGVDLTYRAEMFGVEGVGDSVGFTQTGTTTLDVAQTWIHNPLDPRGATTVMFRGDSLRSIVRPTDGETQFPLGRTVGVMVAGQRHGIVGAQLDMVVDTIDQADRIQTMFGGYDRRTVPTICIRIGAADRVRLPRPFFAGILNVSENDMTYEIGGETIWYGMTGDEVAPPTPGLIVPLLTRADLNAFYPTRAALNAAYLTRLDVNTAYDLAGTST